MAPGLIGIKIGMTQVFSQDKRIPVTAIEAGPCYILAKNDKKVQLGFGEVKETKLKKPQREFLKKVNIKPLRYAREFLKDANTDYQIGQELKADLFSEGDFVDVTGFSIGKGFQGGMKRWHWHGGPASHGSTSRRRVGSIGSSSDPSRVFKGHHLPGHMGMDKVTVKNLKVVKIEVENNLILVKGAVPGHKNALVMINLSRKKKVAEPEHKLEVKKEAEHKARKEAKPGAKKEAKK